MLLLDIEIPTEAVVTRTDREIAYSHLKDDAATFVRIDEYMDYLNDFNVTNTSIGKRSQSKVLAEYFPIISNDLHSIQVKKDSRKNIIVSKDKISIVLQFAPRIAYKNKILLGPINTRIEVSEFKQVPIYDITGKHSVLNGTVSSIEDMKKTIIFGVGKQYQMPTPEVTGYSVNLDSKKNDSFNFLKAKPISDSPLALRYAFDIDNRIELLENILSKGIENNMDVINNIYKSAENAKLYDKKKEILAKENSKLTRLEYMCKVKFPNLFNKNSKEYIFGVFNLEAMPEQYRKALLTEYSIRMKMEEKLMSNSCEHISAVAKLRKNPTTETLKAVKSLIKDETCELCELPALCKHELEYYSLSTAEGSNAAKVGQTITTKYSDTKKSKLYASFCKLCGMKILDMLESDNVNPTEEYSVSERSEDEAFVHIATYTNIKFIKPVSKNTIYKISGNVWDSVKDIVAQMSTKNVKDVDRKINIIILVMASIISMSFGSDYIAIKGMQRGAREQPKNPDIIIKKTSVADTFREALDVFSIRYSKLIKESSYKSKTEVLKTMFVKAYKLLKDSVDIYKDISVTESKPTYADYVMINPSSDYSKKSKEQFEKTREGMAPTKYQDEKNIIEEHVRKILYPFSRIRYSYARYYNQSSWSKDMMLYVCPNTGKRHKWGSYISGNEEFNIKDIKATIGKITSMRCANCKLTTAELSKSKQDVNKLVASVVNEVNEIESFYTVFRYRCLKQDFHNFVKDQCTICKMQFAFIIKKDKPFYAAHREYLLKYNEKIDYGKNESLEKHKEFSESVKNIKITKPDVDIMPETYDWADRDYVVQLKNLGNSEGKEFIEYSSSDYPVVQLTNVFSKLVDKLRMLLIYIGILVNKPRQHKYMTDEKFPKDTASFIKEIYKKALEENIVENSWKTKDSKYVKGKILHILTMLKKDKAAFNFAMSSVVDSDSIFTNYDYAEIKKIFNMSKIIEDSFKEPEPEDLDLFEYSDLSHDTVDDD